MILSLIIIILMLLALRWGWRRGLLETVVYGGGMLVVTVVAALLSGQVSTMLLQLSPSTTQVSGWICRMLAFWLLVAGGGILLRGLLGGIHWVVGLPVIAQVNAALGALLAVFVMNCLVLVALVGLTSVPNTAIKASVTHSFAAQVILNNSPVQLNSLVKNLIN